MCPTTYFNLCNAIKWLYEYVYIYIYVSEDVPTYNNRYVMQTGTEI